MASTDKVIVREKKDMDSWTVYTNTVYPYTTIIEMLTLAKWLVRRELISPILFMFTSFSE